MNEMSKPIFVGKIRKNILSSEFAHRVVKVK